MTVHASLRLLGVTGAGLVLASACVAAAAAPLGVTDPAARPVPQDGKAADAIRAVLHRVQLPRGFSIELYAVVPGARMLALAPGSDVLWVGTRGDTVWRVAGRSGGAPEVRAFAPGLKLDTANGVCFGPDGSLYVVELNRVLRFPKAASVPGNGNLVADPIVPQGELIPPAEESANHSARTCRVGPDGKLYITLGQPYNVQPAAKVALYRRLGIGGIVRMNTDGSAREVFATGLRNSVGQDFNPKDGTLWFTDNQTDRLGDDVPPGELNRATKPGQDFGYPYWNGHYKVAGSAVAADLKDLPEPPAAVFPKLDFAAHQAQLGMVFYSGTMFPAAYRGGIFVAAHGSWNRSVPSGAEVQFVPLQGADQAGALQVFASGFKDAQGNFHGRPVDVAVMADGSLLVSDDTNGAVYRVSYHSQDRAP